MNTEFEKRVGSAIRSARERCGYTQEQLAAKMQVLGCDVTRSALAKVEVGQRHLYPDELRCIKHILGVSYESLLDI